MSPGALFDFNSIRFHLVRRHTEDIGAQDRYAVKREISS